MSQFQLIEILFRISAVFALGLALSWIFRRDSLVRKWIWTVCFASPLILFIPFSRIYLPILKGNEIQGNFGAQVFELEPGYAKLSPTYLGDPKTSYFVIIVATLAILGVGVLGWRLIATLRLVRSAEQVVDEELLALLYELGQQFELADVPMLKVSDAIQSPCVWGVTQPVILLPASLDLEAANCRLVIEHELLHLKQHDPIRLVLYALIQHLLWWNPLVWFGLRNSNLAQEEFIDQKLGSRQGYKELLVSNVAAIPQPVLSRLRGQSHLLTRIRALSKDAKPQQSKWSITSLASFVPILLPFQLVSAYNPDPNQIGHDEVVYVAPRNGVSRLWRMTSDGRNPTPLPEVFTNVGVPSVSPDGKWIAFNRSPNGQEDIYIANVDGTGEKLIVSTGKRDVQPRWSPDCSKLVFCTMVTGNWEIGIVDPVSGTWKLITVDGKRNLEPSIHPNGERIIFSSHRTGSQKLWSMNLDGSGLVQLTLGTCEDTHGRYSKNGMYVLFATDRRTKHESAILDLRTGIFQPLVPLNQLDTGEVEFVDGDTSVVMTSQDGSQPHIAKVDLRDFRFSQVSDGNASLWPTAR